MHIKVYTPGELWIRFVAIFASLLALWLVKFGLVDASLPLIFAFSGVYSLIFSIFMFIYAIFMVKFLQDQKITLPVLLGLAVIRYFVMFSLFEGLTHVFRTMVFSSWWMHPVVFVIVEAVAGIALQLNPKKGE